MSEQKRGEIEIKGGYGTGSRCLKALILSPRVAVHESWDGNGHSVSDPRTGMAYWYGYNASEQQAVRLARRMMRKFGRDPLRGSIMAHGRWKRRPPNVRALHAFCKAQS